LEVPTNNIVKANLTAKARLIGAKALCVQVSPVLKEGFPPQGTGSPVGVKDISS